MQLLLMDMYKFRTKENNKNMGLYNETATREPTYIWVKCFIGHSM